MVIDTADKLLSVMEVSEILHVHPNTLRRWSDAGSIKAYRISSRGDRRYMLADVQEFIKKMKAADFPGKSPLTT